ncbi:MAG: DUF4290 domain-containing protein [Flammeovirgaceae bacterium]|jgi:hypothetical protein|nr:DUF4290 domain-containing protein [Flammeovirgaceae bacterium]|tara:strand:+ start:2562 stop:3206 length:645 start_codon:yes stop_codon:yes gene_type:complete
MEYNTERNHLILREYGRNVQRMVVYLKTIEDQEKRNSYASTLVELMKSINPNVKDVPEYDQKVWDDLFIISGFKLDVVGPYPQPAPGVLTKKPEKVSYKYNRIKFKHYGRSLEILISDAMKLTEENEIKGAVISIGRLMKTFYQTWNKEEISDQTILKTIKELSNGQLEMDLEEVMEFKLFDSSKKDNVIRNRPRPNNLNKSRRPQNNLLKRRR